MKMINHLFLMGILLITSIGINARPVIVPDIEAINQAMEKKFGSGEIAELVELYSDNAVMLPPSSEILSGPEAIQGYWSSLRNAGVYDYSIYGVEQDIDGDVAYVTALWVAKRKTDNGEDITFEGNISNVYKKQKDGGWKISLQSWN